MRTMPGAAMNILHAVSSAARSLHVELSDLPAMPALAQFEELRPAVRELHASSEPWLADWLEVELHAGAVMLAVAASGTGGAEPAGSLARSLRVQLVARFNEWADGFARRIALYLSSNQTRSVVTRWREQLQPFQQIRL
ncbi:hypothetical protein [Curtobacterium flaccumfaciens]|uniref:hypothetical protein n=1 Tax=Curtobacterium flaccumfaciens TaxID=2035 RepID=UPI001E64B2DB|nr:hypothetical protein [Curtobacterium allii]MCE0459482.1 hypothetical protein [Curtobacterium allii]